MLKSVKGIYEQGEIKLQETPDNIPPKTKVIVTFLNTESSKSISSSRQILTNEEIDLILES